MEFLKSVVIVDCVSVAWLFATYNIEFVLAIVESS